jgi:D-aminopeptidase
MSKTIAAGDAHLKTPSGKTRARGLGVSFDGVPGVNNAITDVPGVAVGYVTLVSGAGKMTIGGPCAHGCDGHIAART